ncbi:MAG TPA: TraB/GumN family protein [Paludibacteraceae bacterium]|nr:TraB/GumN family protein [Paludibacteraceae bacterium]
MKRSLISFLIVCFVFSTANAQLLWEISGNHLKQKSYLLGTHHLVSASFLDSIPGVYKAFNRTQTVVGEIVANDPTMIKKMTQAAKLPNYTSMNQLLSPMEYQQIDSALQAVAKITLADLALLKPAMISNLYLISLYNRLYPTQNESWQIDSFFQQVAAQKNRPVIGLETIEKQIDILFNSQSLERQAFLLVGSVESTNEMEHEIKTMNYLYKKGDLNGLLSLYKNDTTKYAATQQEIFEFLDNRNQEWAKTIPLLIHQNSSFIAVGALHLPGESGLIALLRKAGYRVKPIKK